MTETHLGPFELDRVHLGDCIELLRGLESCCIDSCVTDPPYELGFMGKHWDSTGIAYSVELWREVYRVLKPGAHLLAFGGTRTYHRMACAIEDAGFEIRDQMQWLYGSGFPKSHDISKAIDKQAGAEREVVSSEWDGRTAPKGWINASQEQRIIEITAPATPAAIQWQGWGTALKPANEPICVARKPFTGTVAENVLQWGTGAINVDAGRIGYGDFESIDFSKVEKCTPDNNTENLYQLGLKKKQTTIPLFKESGRWPANVLLDEEAAKMLDEQSGVLTSGSRVGGEIDYSNGGPNVYGKYKKTGSCEASSGGASRFFYVAKASKSEREAGLEGFDIKNAGEMTGRVNGSRGLDCPSAGAGRTSEGRANHHPTVKPIKLMGYLVKLVTPPNGIVLDPFSGSGTTGCACIGFRFIGFEKEEKYCEIANKRIEAAKAQGVLNLG